MVTADRNGRTLSNSTLVVATLDADGHTVRMWHPQNGAVHWEPGWQVRFNTAGGQQIRLIGVPTYVGPESEAPARAL